MRKIRRNSPNGSGFILDIEQRDCPFRRGVELEDAGNLKPVLEVSPHVCSQPISACCPDSMIGLMKRSLAMEQISTKLADILKQCAIPALDVAPKLAGRKPVLNDD